jgi:cyanophycinase
MKTFLIGGGRDEAGVAASHEPFVRAASEHAGPIAVLVLDEGEDSDVDRWTAALSAAGAGEMRPVLVSRGRTPRPGDVADASGVYVAGGLTPEYQEALLVEGTAWLDAARERGIPYAGFSAGAAIAAERAVVGGWRARVAGRLVAVCDEEAGEGLDLVEVREGLGLVPFHVDVHAAQWGTLTRLLHALVVDSAPAGAAIDEGTALELDAGTLRVHGLGLVYWARRTAGAGPAVRFLAGGDQSPLTDLL